MSHILLSHSKEVYDIQSSWALLFWLCFNQSHDERVLCMGFGSLSAYDVWNIWSKVDARCCHDAMCPVDACSRNLGLFNLWNTHCCWLRSCLSRLTKDCFTVTAAAKKLKSNYMELPMSFKTSSNIQSMQTYLNLWEHYSLLLNVKSVRTCRKYNQLYEKSWRIN